MSEGDEALPDVTFAARWHYFVSFAHLGGFGNCTLWRDSPINDRMTVARVEQKIEQELSRLSVTVLSFQLIGIGDESDTI